MWCPKGRLPDFCLCHKYIIIKYKSTLCMTHYHQKKQKKRGKLLRLANPRLLVLAWSGLFYCQERNTQRLVNKIKKTKINSLVNERCSLKVMMCCLLKHRSAEESLGSVSITVLHLSLKNRCKQAASYISMFTSFTLIQQVFTIGDTILKILRRVFSK